MGAVGPYERFVYPNIRQEIVAQPLKAGQAVGFAEQNEAYADQMEAQEDLRKKPPHAARGQGGNFGPYTRDLRLEMEKLQLMMGKNVEPLGLTGLKKMGIDWQEEQRQIAQEQRAVAASAPSPRATYTSGTDILANAKNPALGRRW